MTDIYIVENLADSCIDDFGVDSVFDNYDAAKKRFLEILCADINIIKKSFYNYKTECWQFEECETIEDYFATAIRNDNFSMYNGDSYYDTRIRKLVLNKKKN